MKGVSHKPLIIHVLSKPGNLLFALFVKQTPQTLQIMLLVTDVVYALTQTTPKKKKRMTHTPLDTMMSLVSTYSGHACLCLSSSRNTRCTTPTHSMRENRRHGGDLYYIACGVRALGNPSWWGRPTLTVSWLAYFRVSPYVEHGNGVGGGGPLGFPTQTEFPHKLYPGFSPSRIMGSSPPQYYSPLPKWYLGSQVFSKPRICIKHLLWYKWT